MNLYSLDDNKLNEYLTSAMITTVHDLVKEGLIAEDVGEEYCNRHVCMLATTDGFMQRLMKRLFPSTKGDQSVTIVLGVSQAKEK
jgi:hypothetical protein